MVKALSYGPFCWAGGWLWRNWINSAGNSLSRRETWGFAVSSSRTIWTFLLSVDHEERSERLVTCGSRLQACGRREPVTRCQGMGGPTGPVGPLTYRQRRPFNSGRQTGMGQRTSFSSSASTSVNSDILEKASLFASGVDRSAASNSAIRAFISFFL